MHCVRLDPFSSRLLAIRLARAAVAPTPSPENDDKQPAPTAARVHTKFDNADGDEDEQAEGFLAPTGRDVAPTDCHACGKHGPLEGEGEGEGEALLAPPGLPAGRGHRALSLQDLAGEIERLQMRLESLERAAQLPMDTAT